MDLVKNLTAICQPKVDRCNLCAVHVKPDEQGEWNGRITDEGVVYCFDCDPEGPNDLTGVIQPPECEGCHREVESVDADCGLCDECIKEADDQLAEDRGWTDAEYDADALASAGMGTDEDYGFFGGDE